VVAAIFITQNSSVTRPRCRGDLSLPGPPRNRSPQQCPQPQPTTAGLRSLFGFAALRHPEHAELIQQVLAIPQKRFDKTIVSFLEPDEVNAVLAAPNLTRWEGRRDRALLVLAVQIGLRLSELTGITCGDIELGTGAHVRCRGKGRKQRCVPLTPATTAVLRSGVDATEKPALTTSYSNRQRPLGIIAGSG
jgi:site-specific recombinase XerD